MISTPVLEQFAAAVHAVWCDHMQRKGWRRGHEHSAEERTHDAMAPFPELGALDRRNALDAAERLVAPALAEVAFPRGDDREFTADDISVGVPVTVTANVIIEGVEEPYTGRVVSWEREPDSPLLKSIVVKWNNGVETEHIPSLRDLRRL